MRINKYGIEFGLFNFLDIRWCKRAGNKFCLSKDCSIGFRLKDFPHVRGFYLQIKNWGGHLMWKSDKCYEV